MKKKASKKYSVDSLLDLYRKEKREEGRVMNIMKLKNPYKDRDIYNITAPFSLGDKKYIIGRTEPRAEEFSKAVFFESYGEILASDDSAVYDLQDPFFTFIAGEFIFGGVEVWETGGRMNWRTIFYKGADFKSLKKFFVGPVGMKDLRIFETREGIGIFTRPQGAKGGRGKIGFTQVKSLDEINISIIEKAPLIEDFFYDEEWGGVNAVYPFSPNEKEKYLVLGHIAKFTEDGCRHYYPIVFDFDTEKRLAWNVQIIAERSDLPAGEAKRSDLYDIIYSGGLYFEDGKVFLYAGVGDCEAWRIEVFLKIKEDL